MTIHPIPSGTRDVLPDEMRELRDITEAVRGVFELDGYGEVWTPTLEYEAVLARGGGAPPAYRVFDDHGEVLALRTDMTIPIARLVATRYPTAEPPLRFCYFAHAYRGVRPHRGQMREFLQAGIELVGAPAPDGHRRGADGPVPRARRRPACAATGSASATRRCTARLLRSFHVAQRGLRPARRGARQARLRAARSASSRELGLGDDDKALLLRVPQLRGGPEVLEDADGPVAERGRGPARRSTSCWPPRSPSASSSTSASSRDLGYYTGAVFEVYDPALGEPIGGGGRYDDLLGRFGRPLPAVGFALGIDRLHIALTGEEAQR